MNNLIIIQNLSKITNILKLILIISMIAYLIFFFYTMTKKDVTHKTRDRYYKILLFMIPFILSISITIVIFEHKIKIHQNKLNDYISNKYLTLAEFNHSDDKIIIDKYSQKLTRKVQEYIQLKQI